MSKPKFSPDIKIRACEEYLSGNGSIYLSIWQVADHKLPRKLLLGLLIVA